MVVQVLFFTGGEFPVPPRAPQLAVAREGPAAAALLLQEKTGGRQLRTRRRSSGRAGGRVAV